MDFLTVIGLVAASCTTFSFLPQLIQIIKTRHTKDISLGMYLTLTTGLLLWLIYGINKGDLPLIVANSLSLLFAVAILLMKFRYK